MLRFERNLMSWMCSFSSYSRDFCIQAYTLVLNTLDSDKRVTNTWFWYFDIFFKSASKIEFKNNVEENHSITNQRSDLKTCFYALI